MPDGVSAAQNPLSGLPSDSGLAVVPGPTPPLAQNPPAGTAPAISGTQPGANASAALGTPSAGPDPSLIKHVGKLASIGHVFNTLAGTANDYQIDPKTGQTVATPIKQKPGQMFRNMLAGALMGGAAGAGGDFTTGLVKGGAAGVQDQRNQDLQRRAQAQEQFKNQIETNREQREATESKTRTEMMQAQTAFHNVQKLHENQLVQDTDVAQHERVADLGKAKLAPYIAAGITPAFNNVSESEMNDIQKNNPLYKSYDWEPTGLKYTQKADGTPSYELTYSAVKKDGTVKITPEVVKAWGDSGMATYDPEGYAAAQRAAKGGQEWDALKFSTVNMRSQDMLNKKLNQDKETAQTNEFKAQTHKNNLEAQKYQAEIDEIKAGKNKNDVYAKAMKSFREKGSLDALTNEEKEAIAEGSKPYLDDANKVYGEAVKAYSADPSEENKQTVRDAYARYSRLADLHETALGLTPKVSLAKLPKGEGKPLTDPAIQKQYLDAAGGDKAKAQQLALQNGWTSTTGAQKPEDLQQVTMVLPDGTKITTTPEAVGSQMRSAKAKVAPESQKAYDAWYNATQSPVSDTSSLE